MSAVGFSFGPKSLERLSECHPDLQRICNELIKEMNVTVLCGHRNQADQEAAVESGMSREHWPHSRHNSMPSRAVDLAPYPLDWHNIAAFVDMCDRIKRIAQELNIPIRQGRDFSFLDYPHTELAD